MMNFLYHREYYTRLRHMASLEKKLSYKLYKKI